MQHKTKKFLKLFQKQCCSVLLTLLMMTTESMLSKRSVLRITDASFYFSFSSTEAVLSNQLRQLED